MNRYFGLHTLEGEWHSLLPRYLLLSDRIQEKRILDIGCGTGIGSSLLLELGASMVNAIDHRPAVLELARMKHAKDGLDFHVMFWEELDFPSDTFDIVLCLDPGSPVTDPSLIQEVRRVLKDGGEYICAIERKPLEGVESLLPRYGYTEAAENVDVHQSGERVPQIGELAVHFDKVASVVQRPQVSYVFDVESGEETPTDVTRRTQSSGESGIWIDEEGDEDSGRWVSVDSRLCSHDTETGSVELWFCGDDSLPSPPLREVRLPYYSLAERLRQVINDLQMRQLPGTGLGDEDSLFDEVVDNAEASEAEMDAEMEERKDTSEFKAVSWDEEPTTVRQRPDLSDYESSETSEEGPDLGELQSQLHDLNSLYNQVRNDFERVVNEARDALDERDSYIHHLVTTIHDWETRYQDVADSHGLSRENTGVFERPGEERPSRPTDELEKEVERLREEQGRILHELETRDRELRRLHEESEASEADAEAKGADDVSEGSEASASSEPAEETPKSTPEADVSEASESEDDSDVGESASEASDASEAAGSEASETSEASEASEDEEKESEAADSEAEEDEKNDASD